MIGIKNTDERNALKAINLDNPVPENLIVNVNHICKKNDKSL